MATPNPKPIPFISPQRTADFWKHVKQNESNGCQEWQACRDENGYGIFGVNPSGNFRASRIAYFLSYGIDPKERCVLHKCDNPPCCNPEHLFLGTLADNNADMKRKGRQARGLRQGQHTKPECFPKGDDHYMRKRPELIRRGEYHNMAKLSEMEAREIFRRCEAGEKQIHLAREYGVTVTAIHSIFRRKSWTHLNL